MSTIQIDRSPDLLRLRKEGYNIQVSDAAYLLVHDVKYVNSKREICSGVLASSLKLAGDITVPPENDHTAKFVGEYPCDSAGNALTVLTHASGSYPVGNGLIASHSFSRKPGRDYVDYYEKITAYDAILAKHVAAIDPYATSRTGRVIEPEDDNSPFNYLDTWSAGADIPAATAKLAEEAVAIIGLGGTGSYVLDLIAKTPVRKIHLFDGDRFLTHNAFRAPGAPSLEELRLQPLKVEHFSAIYSRMHRGIVPHPFYLTDKNLGELDGMSFVFICMDSGVAKQAIVKHLEAKGIPFADVGMGLTSKRDTVRGTLRMVLSLQDNRDTARARISFANDDANNEYDKNIQVADLNALNACLAVIAWKKTKGFYFNLSRERYVSYVVSGGLLIKGDIA
jgi:hypothetical protein